MYWFGLLVAHKTSVNYNYLSLFLYSLLPLVGGVFALTLLKAWGGFKTMVGKLVGCIGLGLLFFGCGSMVWSYYNFIVSIPVLYPSLADAAFILGVLSYGLSVIFIA